MKRSYSAGFAILVTGIILFLGSCVKDTPDIPPTNTIPFDPDKVYTIEQLKIVKDTSGGYTFNDDYSVFATITADEKSGNLYKIFYVQDETGGIQINFLNPGGLHLGDSIRIYLKGGTVDDYGSLYQVKNLDQGKNIVKIATGKFIQPVVATLAELSANLEHYESTLVRIDSVQFVDTTGVTFADSVNREDMNRDLEDITGQTIIVRTSGYADFANRVLPYGSGSITAIFTRYNTDAQLVIRDYNEVQLTNPRLGVTIVVPEVNTTIPELKALYSGSRLQITDDLVIGVRVAANDQSGNYYKTLVIQDDEGGIELKINDYDLYQSYPEGQEIYVRCQNLYLDTYGEVIQLGSVYDDNGVEKFGGIEAGNLYLHVIKGENIIPVTPNIVSIQDVDDDLIGTLIQLDDVQFVDSELGSTWADAVNQTSVNHTLEDCFGNTIIVRTSGYADFAGETLPEGNGSFIAAVSAYNGTMQLYVRNLDDIDLTGERCDVSNPIEPVENVNEQFDGAVNYTDYSQAGWSNLIVSGTRKWQGKTFGSEKYVQSTGYNSGLAEMETWLITPPVINTNGDKKLTFKCAMAYWEHTVNDPITILASLDYNGTNFGTATWTELQANLPTSLNEDYEWVESGEVSLAGFVGNVAIAFKYVGSDTESTSIQIDNVVVNEGGGVNPGILSEDFNNSWGDFETVSVEGAQVWDRNNTYGPDFSACARMSGYQNGNYANEDWLISPEVDLADYTSVIFTFETAKNYTGNDIEVKISTDYTGDPTTATWTDLQANISTGSWNWTPSGDIDLSTYAGQTIVVGFKYTSTTSACATWEVDNVLIEGE
jgi:hypothetical protein